MVMQVIHDYLCSSQRVDTASLESHLAAIKNLRSNFLLHSLDRKDGCVTCHIYIKNSLLTPVGGMCLCSTSVLHQRPGSLRILRSILAVLSTAHFWTETSDVVPAICWSHSSSLGVTASSAPITTGTTLAFIFHVLQFLLQLLISYQILVFLLLDVAVTWICYVYHHCLLPLLAPSEEFPTWTWEGLVHTRCRC